MAQTEVIVLEKSGKTGSKRTSTKPRNTRIINTKSGAKGLRIPAKGIRVVAATRPRMPKSQPTPRVKVQAPPPQVPTKHDVAHHRFCRTIADPWSGPLSRGITGAGTSPVSALVRRRNLCTVTLNAGDSGVDIFIPHSTCTDPFVATACVQYIGAGAPGSNTDVVNAQNWVLAAASAPSVGTQLVVSAFNRDPTLTIPGGATGRVVASGVRITCLESAENANGVFYHFWNTPTASAGGGNNLAPSHVMGSAKFSANEALGVYPVGDLANGKKLTLVNPTMVNWTAISEITSSFTTGNKNQTSTNWPDVHGTRLFFDGTGSQRFLFEIVSILEYYQDTHKQFASPTLFHPDGEAITMAINAHLSTPNSNNAQVRGGNHDALARKIAGASGAMAEGFKFVSNALLGAAGAVKTFQTVKGAFSSAAAAEELALLAL